MLTACAPTGDARFRLALTAFLLLFVELALIRWLGANIIYLAYFSNFVLVGTFLGIGLGFLWVSRSDLTLFPLTTALLAASFVAVLGVVGPLRGLGRHADVFFMGLAFLLLETKNVVEFALLFGTTWFVNALVFVSVLCSVLAAVEVTRRFRPRRPQRLYALLAVALALNWLVPTSWLLA